MNVSEMSGAVLDAWVAKALGEAPSIAYSDDWPGFDRALDRDAIHVAPMPGKRYQWCAIVFGRPGGRLPEGRGPWLESSSPRGAVAWAIWRQDLAHSSRIDVVVLRVCARQDERRDQRPSSYTRGNISIRDQPL